MLPPRAAPAAPSAPARDGCACSSRPLELRGRRAERRQVEIRVVAESVSPRGVSTISPAQRPSANSGSGSSAWARARARSGMRGRRRRAAVLDEIRVVRVALRARAARSVPNRRPARRAARTHRRESSAIAGCPVSRDAWRAFVSAFSMKVPNGSSASGTVRLLRDDLDADRREQRCVAQLARIVRRQNDARQRRGGVVVRHRRPARL